MFGLKNKIEQKFEVVSPIKGKIISLEEVNDDVFAKKMMGEGFAIEPSADAKEIVSPVNGKIVALPDTKHAIGIKTKEHNIDILVHVGLNTVNLNGKGFSTKIKLNQEVKAGDPILQIDRDVMNKAKIDMTTMVIFTDGYKGPIDVNKKEDKIVKAGDPILKQA